MKVSVICIFSIVLVFAIPETSEEVKLCAFAKMSAVEESKSTEGRGSSSEFMRNLKGFLGRQLEFLELDLCSKNSRSSTLHVLQDRKALYKKKRSPRSCCSIADISVFDGPSTADQISAAKTLLLLKKHNLGPHIITWKEEDLANAVPQISSPESCSADEIAYKKTAIPSKTFPEKQRNRCRQFEASAEGDPVRAEKRAKKRSQYSYPQNPDPDLPMDFKIRIRELTGSEEVAVFIYEKKLFRTDVNSGQNRFLIPCKQVKNDFLTEDEKKKLKTNDGVTGKRSIEVLLIEPSLQECKINLKEWDMGGKSSGKVSENYVLATTWNKVVRDSNLAEGMTVQLWSFRKENELCFALVNSKD